MQNPDFSYRISFTRSALKEIERLDRSITVRVVKKIEQLAFCPRPSGCKKLAGEDDLWRIRMSDYRVIYSVYDRERLIDILYIRHRSKAYE